MMIHDEAWHCVNKITPRYLQPKYLITAIMQQLDNLSRA